jgi:electron transfer flavoprotein beta subunit
VKIVVLVKWSPDASSERRYSPDFTVDRDPGKGRLSELDEYPVEQALRAVEAGLQAEIVKDQGDGGELAAFLTSQRLI